MSEAQPKPSGEHIPAPKRRRRKRSHTAILIFVAAVVVVGAVVFLWRYQNHVSTDNAQIEGDVVPVHTRVAGYVQRILVKDEQEVRKGDTLMVLDQVDYVLKVRQAEADLWGARASSGSGVAGASVHQAQAQQAVSVSNLEAAQANLERARKEYDRTRELHAREITSQAQLDAAEATWRSADAAVRAATEQTHGSDWGAMGASAQVRLSEARIAAAQAALDAARAQLGYTVILAPASGHVAKKNVEPGQFLSAGQALLSVVEDSSVWVVANLKETQIRRIRAGMPAEVRVDAFPGTPVAGRVRAVQFATGSRFSLLPPDNASGNFTKVVQRIPVKIDLLPEASLRGKLLPGMSAEVSIDLSSR